MKAVIQRVRTAHVKVDGNIVGEIGHGLLVLLGVNDNDGDDEIDYIVRKICNMRIFNDENGIMNKSILDVHGDILCISQFTLMASTKKGNRPSYIKAAKGEVAEPIYDMTCSRMSNMTQRPVEKGIFGADMKVSLLNDGPVTIIVDTDQK